MKIIIALLSVILIMVFFLILLVKKILEPKDFFPIVISLVALGVSFWPYFLNTKACGKAVGLLYTPNVTNTLTDGNGTISRILDLYTIQLSLTALNNNLIVKDIDVNLYYLDEKKCIVSMKGELVASAGLVFKGSKINIPFAEDMRTLTVLEKGKASNYFATVALNTNGKILNVKKAEFIFYDYQDKAYRFTCDISANKMASEIDKKYVESNK